MFNWSKTLSATGICAAAAVTLLAGCGSSSSSTGGGSAALTLASSSVVVPQDGQAVTLAVTVSGATSGSAVTVSGLPAGITETFQPSAGSLSGVLTFQGSSRAAAGNTSATVSITVGGQFVKQTLTIVSAPVASLGSNVETSEGVNGAFAQWMSTSFQIFQYTGDIFGSGATATAREQELSNLAPQHIRLQVIQDGIPMKSNTGTAADWDFTMLDQTVQPVLASADQSPEFQIATAPAWMCNSSGQLDVTAHAQDFAGYAANLVRYYNTGGFDWGGQHFKQPGSTHIQWWGIFNEPNTNGISAADYVTLYNTVVPAMLAVDPSLKFSALEFSDYGLNSGGKGDPAQYLPTFLAPSASGGVKAQVDVLSTHFYGTCNQKDTDATLFNNVPQFAQNIDYLKQELAQRGDLLNAQVWVTENNVNADFPDSKGMSVCNPGQTFVVDQRGTSAFFAAWRGYVFSQLAKSGNRALYHWLYSGDHQYGEVDAGSNKYLGYWVDRTLATTFAGLNTPQIVTVSGTDDGDIELLALRGSDGTVKVMIVNHAVNAAGDNNGPGAPRTVVLDTRQSGRTYGAASMLMLDASTDTVNGPTGINVPVQDRIPITFSGYGTAIVTLTP